MKGNPRYALVRVDSPTHCPSRYEKINRSFVCSGLPYCYKCRYGDTKQQLINKVAQVMRRNHLGWCNIERISKEIIEFMGVK